MSETVLGTIANFVEVFTPNPIPPLGSKVKLDDPFIAAFDRLRQIGEDKRDATIERAFYLYTEERHYSHNISTLLYYFLYYLSNYRKDEYIQWDFDSRLTLDIEQLLTNTRSFLDSTYQMALLFSDEGSRIPGRRQKSFGKFAEWAAQERDKTFAPPISFMREPVPWGLTVRRVRDDYVHRGYEAWPFWGSDDVFFYPYVSPRKVSPMPDLFYRSESPSQTSDKINKPIYLRKFIVYVVAPVFAAEQVLGRYLNELFSSNTVRRLFTNSAFLLVPIRVFRHCTSLCLKTESVWDVRSTRVRIESARPVTPESQSFGSGCPLGFQS